jgi:hypothetical protein
MRKSKWIGIVLMLGLLGALQSAWSQDVTAAIVGNVTDSSGSAVKGATVTARDIDRGTIWTAQTNEAGAFNILRIPVGSYSVEATANGFGKETYPPLTLVLNQTARLEIHMKVGKVSETVEVKDEVALLQTQSAEVSTLIDANTAVSLPLSSRNYLQLTLLVPGATNPNPQTLYQNQNMTSSGRPQINGNREQANEVLLDGVVNTEDTNNEVGYQPAPDAIQEFNVITQNASAEFGNYQGGVISASIKSGTNRFHGSVYEFLRNDVFNANTWSAGLRNGAPQIDGSQANGVLDKPKLRWNEFGATFGGPIIKNKLFFFMDYEGGRFDKPSSAQSYQLLTPDEVAGNFGQLCTDNGGSFSPAGICSGPAAAIQLVYPSGPNVGLPIPNNNLATAGFTINSAIQGLVTLPAYTAASAHMQNTTVGSNYFAPGNSNLNNDQGDLKVDYNAGNADHLFFRYTQASITNPSANVFTLGNPGTAINEPMKNIVANWVHTFNPNLLNEARFGISDVKYNQTSDVEGLGNLASQIGIAGGNEFAPGLPAISAGSIQFGTNDLLQNFGTGTGQFADNLIITHGRHTIKTGFQYFRERQNYSYPGNNGVLGTFNVSQVTGSPQADLWLGLVSGGGRDAGAAEFGVRGNNFGIFVQDDWRVSSTLTLNLGLRFEDHGPMYEIKNREVNFGLYTGELFVESGNNALYQNYWGRGDYLPRIGFAWSPAGLAGGKGVFRGGYGISSYMEGGGANQRLTGDWPFTQASSGILPTIDQGFAAAPPVCPVPLTLSCFNGARIKVFDQHLRPANAQQWNLTFQYQFNNTTSMQIGYVGQHGTNLYNFEALQQNKLLLPSGAIAKPGQVGVVGDDAYLGNNIVNSGYIGGTTSNSDSSYNSLQAVLKKTMSKGLEGQVAYTFSKCLTNSPGFFGTGTWGGNGSQTSMGLPGWQNIYDPRSDWGPCYYDETHILTNYVTYQLPFGRGKKFGSSMNPVANAVVGNWEVGGIITWHTGNAVTTTIGFQDPSGTSGPGPLFASERPDCSGTPTYEKSVQTVPGVPGSAYIQWWNPNTFSVPATNTFGTCSAGDLRGPRFSETDMSIHKDFLISESKRLEFRTEFINLFNHPILDFAGGIAPFQLGSGTFGQISASQGERQIQFALKFYF